MPITTITAKVIDISPTGMGITANEILHKNQIISFDKNQPNWQLPDKGVIIWSYKQNDGFRYGLEFII